VLCIFCYEERLPSREHIFSLAIGGTITTDRVCAGCNSILGSRVDSALNNFLPIRIRRAELELAGNSGEPPSIFEIFLGDQKLIGPEANRIRTSLKHAVLFERSL
jgi:HNH endonuclease